MRYVKVSPKEPRGQILVVVAAGLVVLLGICALAIDLGFSWMLHRQEQNAADPASIAAARYLKDSAGNYAWSQVDGENEACFYARENGFFPDATQNNMTANGCVPANDPRATTLEVHAPPISGPKAGTQGYVQVIVKSSHPSFFATIFGQQNPTVVTGAVAANTAGNANSSSLVALQSDCAGGAAGKVAGGGTVHIFPAAGVTSPGGYVHVNSPCGGSTDDVCQNGVGSSGLAISGTLVTPYAYIDGSCTYNGSGASGLQCALTSPCLDEDALQIGDPLAGLPEPELSAFPNGTCPDGTPSTPSSTSGCPLRRAAGICPGATTGICHLTPGVYYGGWDVKSNVSVHLDPGLYILAGGGIKLSGGSSIEAVTDSTGTIEARITIFSTDGPGCPGIGAQCQDKVTFTANQSFKAKATNTASCQAIITAGGPNTCPWRGILLWQDGTASNPTAAVTLGGQASTIMAGTIYAPLAEVNINGGTSTTGCTTGPSASCLSIQVISYRWKIDGGALVEMPYDPAELYILEQRGLVH
jgi:Putative Flp pilus-assembly TadE/G-like